MLNKLFWIVVALFIERILDRKPPEWAVVKSPAVTTSVGRLSTGYVGDLGECRIGPGEILKDVYFSDLRNDGLSPGVVFKDVLGLAPTGVYPPPAQPLDPARADRESEG